MTADAVDPWRGWIAFKHSAASLEGAPEVGVVMQLRETLIDISNDARSWLEAWARDFTDAEALQSDGTTAHPLAWQLGHLASAEDDGYRLFTGDESVVPDAVQRTCGTGCPPPAADTAYPPLEELWALLGRTHARLIGLLERSVDGDLDRPPLEANRFFKSLGQMVYELALHENYHVGEISTLRKALGKPRIG